MGTGYKKKGMVEGSHQKKSISKGPDQKCWTVHGQVKELLFGSYAKHPLTQSLKTATGSQGMGKELMSGKATF